MNGTVASISTAISTTISSIQSSKPSTRRLGLISLAFLNATVLLNTKSVLDSIVLSPIPYSVAGIGVVLGMKLTQFWQTSNRELTKNKQFNRRLYEVISILMIVGFTRQEGIDIVDNLHLLSLDQLVMVTVKSSMVS